MAQSCVRVVPPATGVSTCTSTCTGPAARSFLSFPLPCGPATSGACLCWTRTKGGRFTQAGLMKALETSTDVEPKPASAVSGSARLSRGSGARAPTRNASPLPVPPTAGFCSACLQNRFHLENEPIWPRGGVMPIKAALLEMPYSLPLFYCSTRAFCGLH